MRLYKCLNQTLDLEHVLAVSDVSEGLILCFEVTLALRDEPLYFGIHNLPKSVTNVAGQLKEARDALVAAWGKQGEDSEFHRVLRQVMSRGRHGT